MRFRRKVPRYLNSVIDFLTSERQKIENNKNWDRSTRKQSQFWQNYDNIIKKSEISSYTKENFLPLGKGKENLRPVKKADLLDTIDEMLSSITYRRDNVNKWSDMVVGSVGLADKFVRNIGGLDYTPEAEEMNENLVKFLKKCKNALSKGKTLDDRILQLLSYVDVRGADNKKLLKDINEKIEKATEKSAASDSINLASRFFFRNHFWNDENHRNAYKDILSIVKKDNNIDDDEFNKLKLINVFEYSDDEEEPIPKPPEEAEAIPSTDSTAESETYNSQFDELIRLMNPNAYRIMMKERKKEEKEKKNQVPVPEEEPTPKTPEEAEPVPPEIEITKPISKKVRGKRTKDKTKILIPIPEEEPTPKTPEEAEETVSTTESPESVEPVEATPAAATAPATPAAAAAPATPTAAAAAPEYDPKKTIARIEKVSSSVFDIINQFGNLEETILDMRENLSYIPMDKYEEVADVFAEQLSYATDKEGNKLFNSKSEARRFLDNLRMRNPRRYKLPKAITKEIHEKRPLVLTPMMRRHLVPIHHERGIYQF